MRAWLALLVAKQSKLFQVDGNAIHMDASKSAWCVGNRYIYIKSIHIISASRATKEIHSADHRVRFTPDKCVSNYGISSNRHRIQIDGRRTRFVMCAIRLVQNAIADHPETRIRHEKKERALSHTHQLYNRKRACHRPSGAGDLRAYARAVTRIGES